MLPQIEYAAGGEPATDEHGIAEFAEAWVNGEDGLRCLAHGV
jgi:hypothetical protein